MKRSDVSKFFFQLSSMWWLDAFSWYDMTDGSFQFGANFKASSFGIGWTRKSLNRCHWSGSPGSRDDSATVSLAATPQKRNAHR